MAEIDIALVHRVEQALLGALIAGGDPGLVQDVQPAHFSDDQHQAIYAAVTGQYQRGGLISHVRAWLARLAGLRLARTAAYAAELPGLCPRRSHLLAYGAMILQARQPGEGASGRGPRESGGPDGQLAGADSWLSSATGRRRSRTRDPSQPADYGQPAPATERLARALAPVVARLREELAAEGSGRAVAGSVLSNGFSGARRLFGRADLQDLVLASLMRYPGTGGRELVRRVPPEVFEAGPRRELYMVTAGLIGQGLPVDALIVAWEATRREPRAQPADASGTKQSMAILALQLGEMQTVPGMAGHIGRGLLADHVLTQAHGQDWTRQGSRRPAAASQDAHRAAAVTPGAARMGQVAPRQQAGPGAQPGSFRRPPQPGGSGNAPRHG